MTGVIILGIVTSMAPGKGDSCGPAAIADRLNVEVREMDIVPILEAVAKSKFNPTTDSKRDLPDVPGIYVLFLRDGIDLPKRCGVPIYTRFNGARVLYVGIAQMSLQKRDFEQHFERTAGQSTVRKSLGVLFGYQLIPRDRTPGSRKTKFQEDNEGQLSQWMRQSLILSFAQNSTPRAFEDAFIAKFNPPLNLAKNRNPVNQDFRNCVRRLRSAVVVLR